MVPRLVPEISSKCAFCDEAVAVAVAAGIGDSRSLMCKIQNIGLLTGDLWEGIDQGDVDPMIINWMDIDNMEQHDSI